MSRRHLILSEAQEAELGRLCASAAKPYLRERAGAILKVGAGIPAAVVARALLLRPRQADTVYEWLNRYERAGIEGLKIKAGRGRKPAFSPSEP